ncbi:MAG: carboxypeptidase regulatory-like domain-containing protein [Planctomycetaceae bacterium]|nr:carboxypeptidase regulatory-like domain-containing protein [Planctomycetaceae bacterium]
MTTTYRLLTGVVSRAPRLGCLLLALLSSSSLAAPASDRSAADPVQPTFRPVQLSSRGKSAPAIDLEKKILLRGKVVSPAGDPVAGARLHLCASSWIKPVEIGTTDADGSYELPVAEKLFHSYMDDSLRQAVQAYLIASADHYGPVWVRLAAIDRDDWQVMKPEYSHDLRLVPDAPIPGRVVDTGGKPVGGVIVAVSAVLDFSDPQLESLRAALAANDPSLVDVQKHHPNYWRPGIHKTAGYVLPRAVTDAEGRFQISGVGRDRAIVCSVDGPGIDATSLTVLNHDGLEEFTRAIRTSRAHAQAPGSQPNQSVRLYDNTPTIVVESAQTVAGVVRDGKTGEPIPYAQVVLTSRSAGAIPVYTDFAGRYRIARAENDPKIWLHVYPRTALCLPELRECAGVQNVRDLAADFALSPGVLVTGRAVEAGTNRPIVSGGIHSCGAPGPGVIRAGRAHYYPLANNTALRDSPQGRHFDNFPNRTTNPDLSTTIDGDGRFCLAVPPGPGVLLIHAGPGQPEFAGAGIWRESDDMHRLHPYLSLLRRSQDDGAPGADASTLPGLNRPITIEGAHAYQVINPAAAESSLSVTIEITRAPARLLRFVGPDGRPMPNLFVQGLAPVENLGGMRVVVEDAEAELSKLEWGKPREVIAVSLDGRHIGQATVDVLDPLPTTIALVEAARVTGRVVDETTGLPLVECLVSVQYTPESSHWREPVPTDADGRFSIGPVIPGRAISLLIREPKQPWMGFSEPPRHQPDEPRGLELKVGESRPLGEFRITTAVNPRAAASPPQ